MEEIISCLNEMGREVVFLGDGVPVFKEMIAEKMNVRQGTLWQRYCRTGSIFLGAKMDLEGRSENEG
jgi:tRNA threonylcarbamoyladenosine biosynthesis protein TsaB